MNNPNARERILQTAIKIFAEKSFEGSRIDEIAREAKVPKSLIYYHFKSKDEILEVLTTNFINEYLGIIAAKPGETHQEKAQEIPARMKNVYYEFGLKNADLLRVMLIDSLKKSKDAPILFKVVEAMINKESENTCTQNYNIQERRIAEFFTSFIPMYAYLCFADSWTKYFNIERKEFDKLFMKVYTETHGAYHKNHD
ncbi:TetR/AcrR family transcriptional regulator [Pseudobacteroides cellulosolvens]|uniref:Transcriptional regulator, TetR family n=1 Tax=Pseudobacteroides cellulosolvens ATCC 35603 = DSM 2933 TaxID=398512 RepID=A0A0L6JQJ1_9FIRM|nr:TetR/AcrR family transcriptional regulator [Pseudobacteroides cellulosolvens]KNY27960.1 transcriptional regulator, TetR family [Pseudobacteroides cellulosolvens ATCC 35603 = DSM 2933]